MTNNTLLSIVLLILNIFSFFIGFILGKILSNNGVYYTADKPQSFIKQQKHNSVTIDDKKYVGNINTEGLEKKYNELGDVKKSQDDISSSVNKLKNMKK